MIKFQGACKKSLFLGDSENVNLCVTVDRPTIFTNYC